MNELLLLQNATLPFFAAVSGSNQVNYLNGQDNQK
jgi:hypothetical protein